MSSAAFAAAHAAHAAQQQQPLQSTPNTAPGTASPSPSPSPPLQQQPQPGHSVQSQGLRPAAPPRPSVVSPGAGAGAFSTTATAGAGVGTGAGTGATGPGSGYRTAPAAMLSATVAANANNNANASAVRSPPSGSAATAASAFAAGAGSPPSHTSAASAARARAHGHGLTAAEAEAAAADSAAAASARRNPTAAGVADMNIMYARLSRLKRAGAADAGSGLASRGPPGSAGGSGGSAGSAGRAAGVTDEERALWLSAAAAAGAANASSSGGGASGPRMKLSQLSGSSGADATRGHLPPQAAKVGTPPTSASEPKGQGYHAGGYDYDTEGGAHTRRNRSGRATHAAFASTGSKNRYDLPPVHAPPSPHAHNHPAKAKPQHHWAESSGATPVARVQAPVLQGLLAPLGSAYSATGGGSGSSGRKRSKSKGQSKSSSKSRSKSRGYGSGVNGSSGSTSAAVAAATAILRPHGRSSQLSPTHSSSSSSFSSSAGVAAGSKSTFAAAGALRAGETTFAAAVALAKRSSAAHSRNASADADDQSGNLLSEEDEMILPSYGAAHRRVGSNNGTTKTPTSGSNSAVRSSAKPVEASIVVLDAHALSSRAGRTDNAYRPLPQLFLPTAAHETAGGDGAAGYNPSHRSSGSSDGAGVKSGVSGELAPAIARLRTVIASRQLAAVSAAGNPSSAVAAAAIAATAGKSLDTLQSIRALRALHTAQLEQQRVDAEQELREQALWIKQQQLLQQGKTIDVDAHDDSGSAKWRGLPARNDLEGLGAGNDTCESQSLPRMAPACPSSGSRSSSRVGAVPAVTVPSHAGVTLAQAALAPVDIARLFDSGISWGSLTGTAHSGYAGAEAGHK